MVNNIIDTVYEMELPKSTVNAYTANLKKVNVFIQSNKVNPAINQVYAFAAKVRQDMASGIISEKDGDSLLLMANGVIMLFQ